MPSRNRVAVVIVGCALGCVLLGIVIRTVSRASLTPPPTAKSLDDFREFIPEPDALVKIRWKNDEYFVLFGRQAVEMFAEAPAGYLFSADRELVTWTEETTDTAPMSEVWELGRREVLHRRFLDYDDLVRVQ